MKKAIRTLAVGWYGAANVGDELLLLTLNQWLSELGGELTVVSFDPDYTSSITKLPAVSFFDISEIARTMETTDLLVMGGGGIFQDHYRFDISAVYDPQAYGISSYARPFYIAKQFGVPTLILAHGVGPLRGAGGKDMTRDIFATADFVSVRDEDSAELLSSDLGINRPIVVAPDPSWSLISSPEFFNRKISPHLPSGKKNLGLIVRSWSLEKDWAQKLIDTLKVVLTPEWECTWIGFQTVRNKEISASDRPFLEELSAHLGGELSSTIVDDLLPEEAGAIISQCDAVLAMRLHGAILSLAAGVPTLSYEYDKKMELAMDMTSMPSHLRVRLSDSGDKLAEALRHIMGQSGATWRLPESELKSLATSALAHRKVLAEAMENARSRKMHVHWEAGQYDWLKSWQFSDSYKARALDVAVAERDRKIASLNQAILEHDGEIENLNQAIVERDGQIASLNRAILEHDDEIENLNQAIAERDKQLVAFAESTSWKITRPLRTSKRIFTACKCERARYQLIKTLYWKLPRILRNSLTRTRYRYVAQHLHKQSINSVQGAVGVQPNTKLQPTQDWILASYNAKKIIIIPSAFEFDELVNQRPINAAKYFSDVGYLVIFVAWQWSRGESLTKGCGQVWPNVYQVPLFGFVDLVVNMPAKQTDAIYLLTLPAEILVDLVPQLRQKAYLIVYDIIDEWEEFHRMGQAPWYQREIEENLILQSDVISAVSPALVEKYSFIRNDILLVGNGYTPEILGIDSRKVAGTNLSENITMGYFGHLTDAWFDWPLIFDLALTYPELQFEIIGYGEPKWVQGQINQHQNIQLIGKVHPKDLNKHVRGWNYGIIPFIEGRLARAVDPIKVYEYLYLGLPTFVTGIEHLGNYPLVFYSSRRNVFEAFSQFLSSDICDSPTLDIFLNESTWEERFSFLAKYLGEKKGIRDLYAY